MEEYFFEANNHGIAGKVYVLVIYDISDTKRRSKLANTLLGYGFRVQRSAFEAEIHESKYYKLLKELENYSREEDSIRVYKIIGKGQVNVFGRQSPDIAIEDVILI